MDSVTRKNLNYFIISGIFSTISLNLYSPFAVKFLQRLGGNEFYISLLNSLPGLIGIFASLPGAIYMIRNSRKSMKRHTTEFLMMSRLMILSFAALVFLPSSVAPLLFVCLFAIKSLPESVSQTAFQGFTGDIFKEDQRSTAISLRNKLSTTVAIAISILSGILMKIIPKDEKQTMLLYQIFFVIAVVFGIAEIVSFMVLREPKDLASKEKVQLKGMMKTIFQVKKFTGFTKSSLLFYFGWQMGWPLFSIYQVVNLGADELWLSIMFVVASIGQFIGYGYWNRMIKKKGNAIVASVTTLGMAFNPILMAISPDLYWASALNFISGFFTAGNVTVLFNYLLESTPDENRVLYVGTYNTLINISLTISPIVAHFVLMGTGIFWALVIVAVVRLAGSLVFYLNHAKSKGTTQDITE